MSAAAQPSPCLFGCLAQVPRELEPQRLCVFHFTLGVEQACAAMRRETAGGTASAERQAEIATYVAACAQTLTHIAIGSQRLSDEMKRRILSTFMTLMVLRETLDRVASRTSGRETAGAVRSVGFSHSV